MDMIVFISFSHNKKPPNGCFILHQFRGLHKIQDIPSLIKGIQTLNNIL